MRVIFSQKAKGDLREIALYIARDNPVRALSFAKEIKARCENLAHTPLGYPLADEFGASVRKAVHKNYLILYVPKQSNIEILRILHSARQPMRLH